MVELEPELEPDEGVELVGVEADGVVTEGTETDGVVTVELGALDGATPAGFATRNDEIAFPEVGFGMLAPFGTKASMMSWPFLKRSEPAFFVRIVPVFAEGDFHTLTCTIAFLPWQLWPFW